MNTLKYPILVLIGASSYGLLSSIIKLGYQEGYNNNQLIGGQYLFGWLMLLVAVLFFSRERLNAKQVGKLVLVGVTMSTTSLLYAEAVKELPASIAVVLLFQFSWIGVLLEAIVTRSFPSRKKMISILLLLIGTVLAGGVLQPHSGQFSTIGLVCGFLSAVSFAVYVFVSGRVCNEVQPLTKSFLMTTGAGVIVLSILSPGFIFDGSLGEGLWKYGLILGFMGILIPVVFFAIGMPKVGPGLGSILGAAELPAAVIASVLLLHEQVTWLQWAGIIIIFIGIVVPQLSFRRYKAVTE